MATVEEFMQHLVESGLFSESDLRALSERLASVDSSEDAKRLRDELIEKEKLTAYQAEAIYQGRPHRLIIGRNYAIEEMIGSGGMGLVFRARHRRMRRTVALKVLTSQAMNDEEAINRFYQEVEVAATLDHRNIVRAFDADESNGVHYLVMEYVRGNDLQQIVQREGPLAVGQAVNCVIQAAEGLAHAHMQRVIHRDIKPANLLLNNEGLVKILDMGLARIHNPLGDANATRAGLTLPGSIMGTVDFMGPEQAADTTKADERSDIYSLGCTLFYILIGRPVYDGPTAMVKLIAHRESPIPSLCELRDDVSPELDAVFRKMVAKDPDDRYQNMQSVIEALKPCRTESEAQTRETVTQFLSPAIRAAMEEDFENTNTTVGKKSDTNIQKPAEAQSEADAKPTSRSEQKPRIAEPAAQTQLEKDFFGDSESPETLDVPNPVSRRTLEDLAEPPPRTPQTSAGEASQLAEPPPGEGQTRSQTSTTQTRPVQSNAGQSVLLLAAAVVAVGVGLAIFFLEMEEMLLAFFVLAAFMVLVVLFRPGGRPIPFAEAPASTGNTVPPSSSSKHRRPGIPEMRDPAEADPGQPDESEKTLDAQALFDQRGFDDLREEFGAAEHSAQCQRSRTSTAQSITRRRLSESLPSDIPSVLIAPFDEKAALKKRKRWAEFLGIPAEMTNSVGAHMVLIPSGEFLMGSPKSEEGHLADEKQHAVRLTGPYFLATHPVTVGEFKRFADETGYQTEAERNPKGGYGFNNNAGKMEQSRAYSWRDPGFAQSEDHPVVNITWNDAAAFCKWVSKRERITYRLPTEAEWEFACRAGTRSPYFCGADPEALVRFGNVADASTKVKFPQWPTISAYSGYIFTAPVGSFQPNAFGLYDMHGNVWEWCADRYGKTYYQESPAADPTGPATGENRVLRGGSWMNAPMLTRSAKRLNQRANQFFIANGFRLAATP